MEKDSEKNIEKGFTRYADKIGGLSLKFTSPGFTGAPDRVLLVDGYTFWAELKSAGKKTIAAAVLRPSTVFQLRLPGPPDRQLGRTAGIL